MLQLRSDCAELLKKIDKKSNDTVTCIFGDHIQFEQLDDAQLLPLDLMRIVHDYFDDKMIINCSINESLITFNISDNNNKIVYHYYFFNNALIVQQGNCNQKDDSIMIVASSEKYFNLSRLYYHYMPTDDSTFKTQNSEKGTLAVDNNKYTITLRYATYVSVVRNHEILQRRIIVMKQLIDIIKKLQT